MAGNPYCRDVPWSEEERLLRAWREGETGYPWIDACMAQLRTEGWIHHLGRHAVACFLTRGDLWQVLKNILQLGFQSLARLCSCFAHQYCFSGY